MQPSSIDLDGASPSELMLLAATLGRTDLLVSALNSGADINALLPHPADRTYLLTALHVTVQKAHIDATRALLASSPDLSLRDSRDKPALAYLPPHDDAPALYSVLAADLCQKAARNDALAVTAALAAGLHADAPDSPELANTALHWAASFGAPAAAHALLDAGAPVDAFNAAGATPLLDASLAGHADLVRILLQAAADPTLAMSDGRPLSALPLSDDVRVALSLPPPSVHPVSQPNRVPIPPVPPTPSYVPGATAAVLAATSVPRPHAPTWADSLWPPPRRLVLARGAFTVPPAISVSAENPCMAVAERFVAWLADCPALRDRDTAVRLVGGGQGGLGEAIAFSAAIFLRLDKNALECSDEAYSISVRDFGIDLVASDSQGLFYGCATLLNLFTLATRDENDPTVALSIPSMSISDWPAVRRRGLHLDLSTVRVPKIETLKALIAFMAIQLKMNQLHLNVVNNFARLKGISRSPMFRHEHILELNRWCNEHFVELIPVIAQPSVNSLQVACNPSDQEVTNGHSPASVSQETTPHGKKDVLDKEMLFDEFLPLFDSEQVNLGNRAPQTLFEPSDFAPWRSLLRSLRIRGKKTLHVFANRLVRILADDNLLPGVLPELPARSVMILEAGMEGHELLGEETKMSIDDACLLMRQHGLPFYTCASSMLEKTITGRLSDCIRLSQKAIGAACEQGGVGVLLKDSSLCEHGAPIVSLYQALIPLAGGAWSGDRQAIRLGPEGPHELLAQLYDTYIFKDTPERGILGSIAVSLGDMHLLASDTNGQQLRQLLSQLDGDPAPILEKLVSASLRRAVKRADRVEGALSSYVGNALRDDVDELRISAILTAVGARLGVFLLSNLEAGDENKQGSAKTTSGTVNLKGLPDGRRSDLCNNLLQAIELLRGVWLNRYHKAGFVEAVDEMVGRTLAKLSQGMPYEAYLEERRTEEWVPNEDY